MSISHRAAPATDEYNEFYHGYVSLVDPMNFDEEFIGQIEQLRQTLGGLNDAEASTLHAPYTWTLKQLVGHLIDCERIFSMRLLRISVGDETPIPGIEQNMYVDNLDYVSVSMADLLDEFAHLRNANVLLLRRLRPEDLARRGTASGFPVTANANLYMLAGHVAYHMKIIKIRLGLA